VADLRDIISASLREIGVLAAGEAATYDDANDGMRALNRMLDASGLDRLEIYTTTRTVFDVSPNQATYLLGANQETRTVDGFDTLWLQAPDGWTKVVTGDGTITNETAVYQAGGHCVRMDVTLTGTNALYADFTVWAGSSLTISVYTYATFTSAGRVSVQNRDTGNFLTSAGGWQPTSAEVFSSPAGIAFVLKTLTFDVEDAPAGGAPTYTLRVKLHQDSVTATVYFDTFSLDGIAAVPIPRPVFLDHVNLIDTSVTPETEIPLVMLTEDAWAGVVQKDITSPWPRQWYYNPTFPAGTLTLWPVPTSATTQLAIYVPTPVPQFTSLSNTFTLPPGYEEMIVTNLAVRLCPSYEKTPSALLMKLAADSMAKVKKVNRRVAFTQFPAESLIGNPAGGWRYDIRSDT